MESPIKKEVIIGDCRPLGIDGKPRNFGKTPIKDVVFCRGCLWSWKPSSGRQNECCPKCGKKREVRLRKYKPNVASLKKATGLKANRSTEWDRTNRTRAKLIVGRGSLVCVRCGCDDDRLLEINHKNGGGGIELRELRNKFYRNIAWFRRCVDDLELLCRPCNAIHALELRFGPLPMRLVWKGK